MRANLVCSRLRPIRGVTELHHPFSAASHVFAQVRLSALSGTSQQALCVFIPHQRLTSRRWRHLPPPYPEIPLEQSEVLGRSVVEEHARQEPATPGTTTLDVLQTIPFLVRPQDTRPAVPRRHSGRRTLAWSTRRLTKSDGHRRSYLGVEGGHTVVDLPFVGRIHLCWLAARCGIRVVMAIIAQEQKPVRLHPMLTHDSKDVSHGPESPRRR